MICVSLLITFDACLSAPKILWTARISLRGNLNVILDCKARDIPIIPVQFFALHGFSLILCFVLSIGGFMLYRVIRIRRMRESNQEAVLLALCSKTFTSKVIIFRLHSEIIFRWWWPFLFCSFTTFWWFYVDACMYLRLEIITVHDSHITISLIEDWYRDMF